MKTYKVVFEIEVDAETPLKAAKEIQSWLDEGDQKWQFYVQSYDSPDVFSIDLDELDSDQQQKCDSYIPLIKSNNEKVKDHTFGLLGDYCKAIHGRKVYSIIPKK